MTALLGRLLVRVLRATLSLFDEVRPGWSQPAEPRTNEFGGPLSVESVAYWTHAERVRRIRD